MRRGDVFTISVRGSAGKPRPGVVVQADEFIKPDRPVLVCPLTSELADAPLFRVEIEPSDENGLLAVSQAMVDRLSSALPREIGTMIGYLSATDIVRLEFALINVLGLSRTVALMPGPGGSP